MSKQVVRNSANSNVEPTESANYDSDNNRNQLTRKRTASAARQKATVANDIPNQSPPWDLESPQKRAKQSRRTHHDDFGISDDTMHDASDRDVRVRPRQLSFGPVIETPEPTIANDQQDDPQPHHTNKRIRRKTEKALYVDEHEVEDDYVDVKMERPQSMTRRPVGRPKNLRPSDYEYVVSPAPVSSDDVPVDGSIFELDEEIHNDPEYAREPSRLRSHAGKPFDSRGNFLLPQGRYSYSAAGKPTKAKPKQRAVNYEIEEVPEESDEEKGTLGTFEDSASASAQLGDGLDSPPATPSPRKPVRASADDSAVKRMRVMKFDEEDVFLDENKDREKESRPAAPPRSAPSNHGKSQQAIVGSGTSSFNKGALSEDTVYLSDIDTRARQPLKGVIAPVNPPRPSVAAQVASAARPSTTSEDQKLTQLELTTFTVEARDYARGASNCPDAYLVDNEDGTSSPAEVGTEVLTSVTGPARKTMIAFLDFQGMRPFASVGSIPKEVAYDSKKAQFFWGPDRVAIYAIAGSVVSCNVVNSTTIMPANYDQRELKMIPCGDQWRNLMAHFSSQLKTTSMVGPYEFGCVLTLSSRRSGWSSNDNVAASLKKGMFTSSRQTVSAAWFEGRLPSCIDFDKSIPLYDGRDRSFNFDRADFINMPTMPIYKEDGLSADLPTNTIVIAFFALATWRDKKGVTALSFNLHCAIGLGVPDIDD